MLRTVLWTSLLALALVACQSATDGGGVGDGRAPTASFTIAPASGPAPLTVSFDGSASTDPDGTLTSFAWTFGDGTTGTGATVEHTYDAPGTFTVRLTVTADDGASASTTGTVQVTDGTGDGGGGEGGGDEGGGDEGGGDEGGGGGSDGTDPLADIARTTGIAFGLGESTPHLPDAYASSAADLVLIASSLAGGDALVGTGTLTETSADVWTYDPAPNDRLLVHRADGRSFDVVLATMNGDFSDDGARYVLRSHHADLTVVGNAAAGGQDLRLQSFKDGGVRERRATGASNHTDGTRWTMDVQTVGTYASSAESVSNEVEERITGTLEAAEPGIVLTLDKHYRYRMINFVENILHDLVYEWSQEGSAYRLEVETFIALRESKPVDTDQWRIGGRLVRDGSVIGTVEAAEDPTGLSVWLRIGDHTVDLYFFSYL